MEIDRNAAKLLAEMFDKDYPTDQRGIGNLGRAYLELLGHAPVGNEFDWSAMAEMAAYGEEDPKPRSVWWWISPRALWKRWGE